MYTSFFGLNEPPFSITPDPRYLFMSERHGEALAHLVYGVTESGGFMQLTGEVGTGKTTLVRTLLQDRLPDNADVAVVLNPQLSAIEFLATICEELGIGDDVDSGSSKALVDRLNQHLLTAHSEGRRTVLVVDEAQNLQRDVLEQVRLLTNLETSKQKLLQIILIGQPELRELLARNDLRQLAQRITGRYHLQPLSRDETAKYVEHRLRVAGALGEVFDAGAKREIFKLTGGVPRLINVIADRALLGAYGKESRRVTRTLVRRAAAEISGTAYEPPWIRYATPALVSLGVLLVTAGGWSVYTSQREAPEPIVPAANVVTIQPQAVAAPVEAVVATPEPVTVEEPVEISLDEQLRLASDLTGFEPALADLFALWGLEYGGGACDEAAELGYECVSQRGSWNSLRQLDRPAILTLVDSRGSRHSALLTAINGQRADLSIGGVSVSHAIDDVSSLWFGQFLLMWRPASADATSLGPGVQGPAVLWLRQSLAAIDERYAASPSDSDIYDEGLANRVRDFQRDRRLTVDGYAGRQTQIIINTLLAPDSVPTLTTPRLASDR
ncbi:MAG: AAA family ATPase [Pseudomonadota bacterium]